MEQLNKQRVREIADKLSKSLADEGSIIEGGWVGFCLAVTPKGQTMPQIQHDEMRKAFFAGAQHLFASIMSILDPGSEPTQRDLDRMTLIHEELEAFRKNLELQYGVTGGRG